MHYYSTQDTDIEKKNIKIITLVTRKNQRI